MVKQFASQKAVGLFEALPVTTKSSSADEIANVNFVSCARKRLCVGMQVYQIH